MRLPCWILRCAQNDKNEFTTHVTMPPATKSPAVPLVSRPQATVMLSRVASSLYWMSRYIERAENIARILDVNLQLLLDFRDTDENAVADYWLPIVECTGDEELFAHLYGSASAASVAEFLVFEERNLNSIVSSICQARENARMVRDQITFEIWEELNRLYLFVISPQARVVWSESPTDFFNQIKGSSLQVLGLSYATL